MQKPNAEKDILKIKGKKPKAEVSKYNKVSRSKCKKGRNTENKCKSQMPKKIF